MNRKERRRAAKRGAKTTGKPPPSPPFPTAVPGGGVAGVLLGHAKGESASLMPTERDPAAKFRLAASHLESGRLDLAASHLEDLLDGNPEDAAATQLLGVVRFQQGDRGRALELLRRATVLAPDMAEAHHNLGLVLSRGGEFEAAAVSFLQAVELRPEYADAWLNLGVAERALGRMDGAGKAFAKAAKLAPQDPGPRLNQAILARELDQLDEALSLFEGLIMQFPDYAEAHNGRGGCLLALGRLPDAAEAYAKAAELAPDDPDYEYNMREARSRTIPSWHFPMLGDQARNEAYQQALERHVTPGMHVVDIGAGSGLLAMMAARAGAAKVTAVELNPALAEVARQIIADNGLGDRIEVLNRVSLDLKTGQDLPEADLVVSEVLDAGLLGEGVLPTLRHAAHQLLKTGGRMIPSGATVYGQIVELPGLRAVNPVGTVAGFDLSAFDRFRNPAAHPVVDLRKETHTPLSEPFRVAQFDFADPPMTERWRVTQVPIIHAGEAYAVVFWFDLHLDDMITVSTGPEGTLNHWAQAVQFLGSGRSVSAGEELPLSLGHSDSRLQFAIAELD